MPSSRAWLLVPLLAANYFFMVARHEGCHALVAVLSGAHVLDVHLWPPRNWNLGWTTVVALHPRAPSVVRLQAALPHAVGLGMLFGSLYVLSGGRGGRWRRHVVLTGIVFPLLDLSLHVATYWFADNDYAFVFGPGRLAVRATLTAWIATLAALSAWVVVRGRPREALAHGGP